MSPKRWIKHRSNHLLRRYGFEIVPTESLYEWQRIVADKPSWRNHPAPGDASGYLKPDNPKLLGLQRRYSSFHADATTPSVWTDRHVSAEDIAHFRGDNAWVWQVRGRNANVLAYALSFYYLKSIDRLGLLDKLTEDESFGNFVFSIAGRHVSRDLLDSVGEIHFLDRRLGLGSRAGARVLDIGAGYGRLAHRMVSALDGLEAYYCTDAVAVSTFVSEYYLRFRDAGKAVVIPLDEIETALRGHPVDLAVNIHSFSECRMQAIEWWIRLLSANRVKNLMIVPNWSPGRGDRLLTNDGQDFLPLLERYGYRTVVKEPKYLDPVVQEFGLYPGWRHLFEFRE
jgi:putative sugar O-methyltransferase